MGYDYVTRDSALRFWNPDGSRKQGLELGKESWEYNGVPIMVYVTGRSIWERPFMGGRGEVRQIGHMYLQNENEPKIQYGMPVYEDELVPFRV